MLWTMLLFDLVPLIVFTILDTLGNMRYALIGAVIAAIINLLYSHLFLGGIDAISLVFVGIIVFSAALSYYAQNPLFFKLKPAAIACMTACIMLVTSAIDTPVMVEMVDQYAPMMPEMIKNPVEQERLLTVLERTNLYMGFGFIIYAIACTWAAFYMSRWSWLAISGPGLYLVITLCAVLAI